MEKVILSADIREELGKEANKKLRDNGVTPGVIYKRGKESQPIKMDSGELFKVLHTSAGSNVIITLKIKSAKKEPKPEKDRTVIVKEIQYDPIKGNIVHIDLHEISLTEKIIVDVPIEPRGQPEGLKDGGILDQPIKALRIECLPTEIPQRIEVKVEALKIGDAIRVKELVVPSGIKVLNDPELTVVSVVPPHVEKPAEEIVAEEVTEPEVIREKKPEAAEEEVEEEAKEQPQPKKEKKE